MPSEDPTRTLAILFTALALLGAGAAIILYRRERSQARSFRERVHGKLRKAKPGK